MFLFLSVFAFLISCSTQAEAADKQPDKSPQDEKSAQQAADKLTLEQKMQRHATEQWLRQIPDDPSGLLRNKFLYENRQRAQQPQNDGKPIW